MTNTKHWNPIYAIAATLTEEQQEAIKGFVNKRCDLSKQFPSTETLISSVIIQLMDDVAVDEAKASGKNNQLKAMKYILSRGKLHSARESTQFVKTIDGWQYACDSYMLAKIKPLNLPEVPDRIREDYFNVEKILSDFKKASTNSLELPNITKLKAYIKNQKAIHKGNKLYYPMYNFGVDLPLVNAEYLANVMDIMTGDIQCYYSGLNSALYLTDSDGNEAAVCPISKKATKTDFVYEKTEL